nr:hypothetical protein CFP56_70232 [Quercus suber]
MPTSFSEMQPGPLALELTKAIIGVVKNLRLAVSVGSKLLNLLQCSRVRSPDVASMPMTRILTIQASRGLVMPKQDAITFTCVAVPNYTSQHIPLIRSSGPGGCCRVLAPAVRNIRIEPACWT